MASEDPYLFAPGFLAVHRLRDFEDRDQTVSSAVPSGADDVETLDELLKVSLLRGVKRVVAEERDDHIPQMRASPHYEAVEMLAVIIVPSVGNHPTDGEESLQLVQHADALCALRDCEFVTDLKAGLVAASAWTIRLSDQADREATFSVYETSDPVRVDESFLLIVWLSARALNAPRIVAAHSCPDRTSLERAPEDAPGVPAFGRISLRQRFP